ncbi:hypothetical protein [Streptomyces solaniscabiei]|uniref:hypothetical protein n=1 Tax=Streptomyces solaniscabiei TaxID=2683255 RepID=UPI001CE26DB9|nr:hypothetical protein [Streptomyces solaniscabiei]
MRALTVFFQFVLTLGVVITVLAGGLLLVNGSSILEFGKALGLLALFLALLLVIERRTTGRWFRWSRR